MSAKEMFEKLGYKVLANNDIEIMYVNDTHTIIFHKINIDIYCTNLINIDLLQAINKQIEELGWNNVKD